MLRDMANVLPKGSFSKLGLSAGALRNAFSSLTSSLTTLRSETGASGLTERRIQPEVVGQSEKGEWDIYVSSPDHPWAGEDGEGTIVSKQVNSSSACCRWAVVWSLLSGRWQILMNRDCPHQASALREGFWFVIRGYRVIRGLNLEAWTVSSGDARLLRYNPQP